MDRVKPDGERQFLFASWSESLKTMSNTSFLSLIVNYPKDLINAEMVDFMVPYMKYK